MTELNIAFWNLQNLFDTSASEIASDLEFTPEEGWTAEALDTKMENIVQIIAGMFGGDGPDILGVCEIENEALLQDIADRLNTLRGNSDYVIVHHESADIRGIDCALIYSRAKLGLGGQPDGHLVHFRYPTRDIFEVPLRVNTSGELIRVYVTHWPSRIQSDSEHFRISVASHLGRLIDHHLKMSLTEIQLGGTEAAIHSEMTERWDRNVVVMGDLNDDPFNASVMHELLASANVDRLEEPIGLPTIPQGRTTRKSDVVDYVKKQAPLYNPSWEVLGTPGVGSIFWGGDPSRTKQVFDQIIVSRGLYYGNAGLKLVPGSFEILTPVEMRTSSAATEQHMIRPKKFDKGSLRGFSDHFPVAARLSVLSSAPSG